MKASEIVILLQILLLTSCITTRDVPDGDQLFTGLKKIAYEEDSLNHTPTVRQHLEETKEEVEAALATAPNGALFGSSYYHVPFSWRLWVYNRFSGKESKFAKWMLESFGKPPVLMSKVNPTLRASVAQSVLRNNGYFRSDVSYEAVTTRNPKKGKLAYTVHLDSLFTFDSVAYVGYPETLRHLIDSTANEAVVRRGMPFSVSSLENERSRISTLLRNNGYYYYAPSYSTFSADTVNTPLRVQLRIKLTDGLPEEVLRKWYIGNIDIRLRRSVREQLTDSLHRRYLNIFYSGKKPPIRPRVLLKNMRLFPRQAFSYDKYQETISKLNGTGVFSGVDFQFSPRDHDTLDVQMTCTLDKPYDFYYEANLNGRTIGRYGPEMKVGFTKHNAFHGGEDLDVNLHGNYEWQLSSGERMNNYQYGCDISLEFPRILAPFYNSDKIRRGKDGRPRRRFFSTPTTLAKLTSDVIIRPEYYRMNVSSGEWTYRWQSSEQSTHEFSPLTVKYQRVNSKTEKFNKIVNKNFYLLASVEDRFIPQMRYTYIYNSPKTFRDPIRWEMTLAEAGNVTALYDVLIQGNSWNDIDKTLFKNAYSQFVRLETDFTKKWQLSSSSQLVGHLNAGIIYSYGNSETTPFCEMFYAGGANSIRAFAVRGCGPGGYIDVFNDKQFSYVLQNGDIKLIGNLEYRTTLFGKLGGAVFLDMGNVWKRKGEYLEHEAGETQDESDWVDALNILQDLSEFKAEKVLKQIAIGTGVGLRYDLGFLVIRVDWGLALHVPYEWNHTRYFFNWDSFKDAHTLHFAIGYPF